MGRCIRHESDMTVRDHPMPRSNDRARQPAGLLFLTLLVLLLGACSVSQTIKETPEAEAARINPVDQPDPFSIVDQATRHIGQSLERPPERPPHLWARLIDRFEFSECPADSSAEQWARWFGERPEYMERVMNRARPWLYDIAGELEQRELPGELALLPIIESAYDPFAYSHGRAAGTWQFVSATALERGIVINDFYDGRRDVWTATRAALDYLDHLYSRFGDWNLALAAYNGGQGRVQRAIDRNRRAGRATDWASLPLPRETLGYVPKLHGLGCLFADPGHYGFDVPVWDNRPQIVRLELDGPVDIVALSVAAGMDIAELVAINPGLNGHLTPPGGPHHLIVRAEHAGRVDAALAGLDAEQMISWREVRVRPGDTLSHLARRHNTSIASLRNSNDLENDFLRAGQTLKIASSGLTPDNSPHAEIYAELSRLQASLLPSERVQHRVRSGESLWLIARRYGVSVSELQSWNSLGQSQLIRPGDQILVNMSRTAGASPVQDYTVRRGDSLWTIARRHQVSMRELMRWNGLSESSVLRPGQTLTIRGGGSA